MNKSILCKQIPKEFNADKNVALQYFKEFGRIRQLDFKAHGTCLVEYETAEEARRALHESGFYKGKTFVVKSGRFESSRSTADEAVQAELDIMSGTGGKTAGKPATKGLPRPQLPLLQTNFVKKPTQATLETIAPPPTSPVMIHKMSVPELQRLIATPALTSEQKYRVLDARDKLTRIHLSQTTDITKARSTKGTCPDMCPEKERLMREAKHQVASFETEANSRHIIDHKLAVKQYSRSSADQEMSLPGELRSEPVLRMTMMYLLHEIADLCDTSNVGVSDWFHFLWDRTRSIRKDIAQQELCCQGSVRLVEQCARFHIHCAGRLIAEEPQVFDQKINTENLTKCLQSLKYMYHDLRLKGEHCRNESEFRAYIILLNLNDSNFLWEVKQLPASIQHSAEVRFGIDVFKALEQNNYVRFFKLVRRTTYLNGCILLRYFNQVRSRALATIVKAYSIKSAVPLSLSSLAYSLAFEDEQAAIQFFAYYGLSSDSEQVFVDRSSFYYPDLPYFMDRAINVVEQKRFISVGAVIAGGEEHLAPQAIYANHEPENSFDSRGLLKTSEHVNVSVEGSVIDEQELEESEHGVDDEYAMDDQQDYDKDNEEYQEEMYEEQEEENSYGGMEGDDYEYVQRSDDEEEDEDEDGEINSSDEERNDAVDHVFKKPSPVSLFRSISTKSPSMIVQRSNESPMNNHQEKKLPDLPSSGFSFAQLMAQETPNRTTIRSSEEKSIFNSHTDSTSVFSFATALVSPSKGTPSKPKTPQPKQEQRQTNMRQRLADIQILADAQSEALTTEVCAEVIRSTANSVLQNHLRMRENCERCAQTMISSVVREIIEELYREECLNYHVEVYARQKTLKRAFSGWKQRAATNRVNRDRTQMTPMWLPALELHGELKSRHEPGALGDLLRYRLGEANTPRLMANATEQLHIENQIAKGLSQKYSLHSQLLFNVVVSIPAEDEGVFGWRAFLDKWLREHLNVSDDPHRPLILKDVSLSSFQSVGVCVRLVVGSECRREDGRFLEKLEENLDGVIFYMSEKEGGDSQSDTNRRRLQAVLDRFRGDKVPVVVFNLDAHQDEEDIMIKLGMDDDRIGPVLIDPKMNKRQIRDLFREAVDFMVEHYSIPNGHLRTIELVNLVAGTIGETLWMRLTLNSAVNAAMGEILRRGELLAQIYNEAVDKVLEFSGKDFTTYPDVPKELEDLVKGHTRITNNYCHFPKDWRSMQRRKAIRSFIQSLKLNNFPSQVQIVDGSFQPIESLYEFLRTIFAHEDSARNVLYQMVESLRGRSNWVDPMLILTRELFMARLAATSGDLPELVVYNDLEFVNFQDTPWWLQSNVVKRKFEIEPEPVDLYAKKRRLTPGSIPSLTVQGLDDILSRANKCVERANQITLNFKQNQIALEKISSKYDDRLTQLTAIQDTL